MISYSAIRHRSDEFGLWIENTFVARSPEPSGPLKNICNVQKVSPTLKGERIGSEFMFIMSAYPHVVFESFIVSSENMPKYTRLWQFKVLQYTRVLQICISAIIVQYYMQNRFREKCLGYSFYYSTCTMYVGHFYILTWVKDLRWKFEILPKICFCMWILKSTKWMYKTNNSTVFGFCLLN